MTNDITTITAPVLNIPGPFQKVITKITSVLEEDTPEERIYPLECKIAFDRVRSILTIIVNGHQASIFKSGKKITRGIITSQDKDYKPEVLYRIETMSVLSSIGNFLTKEVPKLVDVRDESNLSLIHRRYFSMLTALDRGIKNEPYLKDRVKLSFDAPFETGAIHDIRG